MKRPSLALAAGILLACGAGQSASHESEGARAAIVEAPLAGHLGAPES